MRWRSCASARRSNERARSLTRWSGSPSTQPLVRCPGAATTVARCGRGLGAGGVKFTLVEDQRCPRNKRRKRPRLYGKEVLAPLQRVWLICDGICGKRLAPYLRTIVSTLERVGEMTLDAEVRRKLIRISPATIDRLLATARGSAMR